MDNFAEDNSRSESKLQGETEGAAVNNSINADNSSAKELVVPDPQEQESEARAEQKPFEGDKPQEEEKSSLKTNIIAGILVAAVLAFNAYVYLGSQEDTSRTGTPPAPPAPTAPAAFAPVATVNPDGLPNDAAQGQIPPPPDPTVGVQQQGTELPAAGVTPAPPKASVPEGMTELPAAGVTPPPPPPGADGTAPKIVPGPPAQGGTAPAGVAIPQNLSGPQLIFGVGVMCGQKDVSLSSDQKKKLKELVVQLGEPEKAMIKITEDSLCYLTEDQVAWILKNRGPAIVKETVIEPGMDPLSSAANKLLREKSAKSKGKAKTVKHSMSEPIHYHDILNGILRLEYEEPKLAITDDQAKALMPMFLEANKGRQTETKLFAEIYSSLTDKQVAWLKANPDKVNMDVNGVIIEYARMALEK
ncbi:MAG: hypothetical protein K6G50_13485 [bacterium]|nr:hypothetical protein [bacterium]